MKRILLSCMTILFAISFAGAQTYPPAHQVSGPPKGEGHIYLCADYPHPVDLTYDVLGVHLDINKGQWTPVYPHTSLPAAEYDGRNVFKVIASTHHTYVFDFTTKAGETFCGVGPGQYYRAYVHILPAFGTSKITKTEQICKSASVPAYVTDPLLSIPAADRQAILNAGGTLTPAKPAFSFSTTNVGTYVDSTYVVATIDGGNTPYPCDNDTVWVKMTLHVVDSIIVVDSLPKSKTFCLSELQTKIDESPLSLFGRSTYGGAASYTAFSTPLVGGLIDYSGLTVGTHTYTYTYYPNYCNGGSTVGAKTIVDTIKVVTDASVVAAGAYNLICRLAVADTLALNDIYNNESWINGTLTGGGSPVGTHPVSWTYLGVDIHNSTPPSLGSPFIPNSTVDKSLLFSGHKYSFAYMFNPSGHPCWAGKGDTLVVEIRNATSVADGRLQVCQANQNIDINQVMNLSSVTWSVINPVASTPALSGSVVSVLSTTPVVNTYSYKYQASGLDACESGAGTFYLTVTNKIIAADQMDEVFCVETLPTGGVVSLDYIAGFVTDGSWALSTSPSTPLTSPIIDLTGLAEDTVYTYVFTPAGTSCLGKTVTVNIKVTKTGL